MKTITFFNNKGGVGKTSLVYHIAWMLAKKGHSVIVADLDPQCNLSGMFLSENAIERIWDEKKTLDQAIAPLFEGLGDISHSPHIQKVHDGDVVGEAHKDTSDSPHVQEVHDRIGLLVGDLALSSREDSMSESWPKCLDQDARAFRVITSFARVISGAGELFKADYALIDVGPSLGAINRSALLASDYVVIPLAPDLFSLQGLRNVGGILKKWRDAWAERLTKVPDGLKDMPSGKMIPIGYLVMRHSVREQRPVKAFLKWIEKIPSAYRKAMNEPQLDVDFESDPNCLAHLRDYRSLMPLAQEARKPMFLLKPGDGAIAGHQSYVTDCYGDFSELTDKIIKEANKRR